MKLLITGAQGFVGTHLLQHAANKHEVVALSRPGSAKNIRADRYVELDLSKAFKDFRDLPEVDVIIYLAQGVKPAKQGLETEPFLNVNCYSAVRLMQHAIESGCQHFIYASTGSVYLPNHNHHTEASTALNHHDLYAASKLSAEALLTALSGSIKLSIMRIFHPYGPGQKKRLIPNLITRIQNGDDITLPKNTSGISLCPLYISDLCEVVDSCLQTSYSGILNVGGPQLLDLEKLCQLIGDIVGKKPKFKYVEEQEVLSVVPSLDLLRTKFTRIPQTLPEVGLAKTIDGLLH